MKTWERDGFVVRVKATGNIICEAPPENVRLWEEGADLIAAAPELQAELESLVARCDGEEGVRADGSNIQTVSAHALLARLREEA